MTYIETQKIHKEVTLNELAAIVINGFGGVKQDLKLLETRLETSLENKIGGLENKIGGLENKIGGLENKMGGLEKKVDMLSEDIEDLARMTADGFREAKEDTHNSIKYYVENLKDVIVADHGRRIRKIESKLVIA